MDGVQGQLGLAVKARQCLGLDNGQDVSGLIEGLIGEFHKVHRDRTVVDDGGGRIRDGAAYAWAVLDADGTRLVVDRVAVGQALRYAKGEEDRAGVLRDLAKAEPSEAYDTWVSDLLGL